MKKFISLGIIAIISASLASCSMGEYDNTAFYDGGYYNSTDGVKTEESGDNFEQIQENGFIDVSKQPTSTFSVDADGATYAYMRACLSKGRLPDPNSVRIEEYLNYFTFDYADPEGSESVAINAELGACPWNNSHKLLRLGLKGKSMKDSEIPDANFIFLVDVSGSMMGDDRLELVKTGLCTMVDYMKPSDRIAIITYSGEVKKVLESTLVKDAESIKKAIKKLEASGCTSGGAAMKMAYEEATEHYLKGGNNRIIMCTDGDFNVGVSSTEALVEMVESYLDKGIYLSIMGFGMGNFQDSRMENISNHGNGTYNYIDSEEEMMKVFVNERSRFYSVANDTKCQISFDSTVVKKYRLIGYENRVMNNEDFENDKKDAGEIGAGQTITALYELVPAQGYAADASAASFDVRYKKALGEDSRKLGLKVIVPEEDSSSENIRFASGIAAYGLYLRNSEYKGEASLEMAAELVGSAMSFDPYGLRKQLGELMEKAKK
ncbi:MAG: von Willebrand factor type A domain-containing protein [Bacteroidales bacterium]|nr:von Willebrand factor type A domain-containing protein [Bacteroidales bacterium]